MVHTILSSNAKRLLFRLMLYFYNVLLRCSLPFLKLISVFNSKLKSGLDGRKSWRSVIEKIPKDQEIIWFHCSSLGEFDQGLPLMNLMKMKNSSYQIVVTFFSPSGLLHYQKRKNPVDFALYLLLQPSFVQTKFISNGMVDCLEVH